MDRDYVMDRDTIMSMRGHGQGLSMMGHEEMAVEIPRRTGEVNDISENTRIL